MEIIKKKETVKVVPVMQVMKAEDGNVVVYCQISEPDELLDLVANISKALANLVKSKKSKIIKPKVFS